MLDQHWLFVDLDASSAAETSFTRNNNPVMYQDDIVVPLLTGDIHNLDIDSNSEDSSLCKYRNLYIKLC